MNIYVGNMSYEVTDDDLREAFETHGEVSSANVIKDKYSGQSKGFGFVEMPDDQSAMAAIEALDQTPLKGRSLKVNKAKPRTDNRGGGRGGGRGGYGGGGRNY